MKLLVRGQDIAWLSIGLSDERGALLRFKRIDVSPERYFTALMNMLQEWGIGIDEVTAVGVVRGPGSQTALRASVTIGNTLAFARTLPICAVVRDPSDSDDAVFQELARTACDEGACVAPAYGRDPLITKQTASVF